MVYGTLDKKGVTFEQRVQSWRDKGYRAEFMTGVAWGDYQDYFLGKWDGVKDHLKEGQRDREGREIAHGHLIPYIVPTESFIRYMQEKLICPVCREEDDTTITQAKTPTALMPHSPASPDMVAMVMYQKSFLHLPFYRQ